MRVRAATTTALLLVALALVTVGCGGEDSGRSAEETTDYREPTMDIAAEDLADTQQGETTGEAEDSSEARQYDQPPATSIPDAGEETVAGERVTLRLEGGARTNFSGVCITNDERTVISGEVPKRYAYELAGDGLECRIQKQSSGSDSLRVILTDGERTRSVQQTNQRGSTIELSYSGSTSETDPEIPEPAAPEIPEPAAPEIPDIQEPSTGLG